MEAGIAREVAVQHGTTSITQAGPAAERLDALTPVVPVVPDAPPVQPAGDGQPETKAILVGPDQRALELSYQLYRASKHPGSPGSWTRIPARSCARCRSRGSCTSSPS